MEALHPAKREMIEAGGRTAQSFGLSRLLGQIYTLLYLSSGVLSLDAIAESLGVSKASISIACRQLESWGALKRSWVKGDRRDYYIAETDFRRILGNGLMASVLKKLDSAKVQIERSLSLLGDDEGDEKDREFLRERLHEANEFRSKMTRLLDNPIVKTML